MQVGDLIRDAETRDVGLILEINYDHKESYAASFGRAYGPRAHPYRVVNSKGYVTWLEQYYIEHDCEVISEG